MKIVNLETFRSLPEGTLFAKYQPCCFDELNIKGETWPSDFLYTDIVSNIKCEDSEDFFGILEKAKVKKISFDLDLDSVSRDGCFENDQLFAILEKKDLEQLINKLQDCYKTIYKEDLHESKS